MSASTFSATLAGKSYVGLKPNSLKPFPFKDSVTWGKKTVSTGFNIHCMKTWNPIDNKKFETLSYLPPLSDESIAKEIDYMIKNKWVPCLEFDAAVGAVGGAMAIGEVMPVQYKHMLGGPSLKVDLHTGAIAEGVLTFTITFAILLIVLKGPRSPVLKTWLISMATVALVVTGSSYTGPAMNPANAFGWAYINNWHNTWDQLYVYWICPFIGAILAASVFRILFPIPAKQKKA